MEKITKMCIRDRDIKDLLYLCAHMHDRELVESLSAELMERIKPFEYSLNA